MSILLSSGIKFKDIPREQWEGKCYLVHDSHVIRVSLLCSNGEDVVVCDADGLYSPYVVSSIHIKNYEVLIE